jgi:prepilin-type N-terminal cleavage/methylation domain-containing protein
MKKNGFTIIELVVVIAIIAVLAALVVLYVTQYINKSRNTAIKQTMANIITAELGYYSANSGYANVCSGDLSVCPFSNFINYINKQGGDVKGLALADSYCLCSSLLPAMDTPEGSSYCIDSSGQEKQFVGQCALTEIDNPGGSWITCVSNITCTIIPPTCCWITNNSPGCTNNCTQVCNAPPGTPGTGLCE